MYSGLEDVGESRYIKILREFQDYKELLNVEDFIKSLIKFSFLKIKNVLNDFIQDTKLDKISRILPVLISSEGEKVQIFNLIGERVQDGHLINFPIPPEPTRIFYHIYNCLIEELGLEILEEISSKISTQHKRKTQCVKALSDYLHDKEKRRAVIQWFLGEELSENEKNLLGFESDIQTDDESLEMIKLISETTNRTILLYFDDIELLYEKYDETFQRMVLDALITLNNEVKRLIIILICPPKEKWSTILSLADKSFSLILEPGLELYDLSLIKTLIAKRMYEYWLKQGISPPKNKYFPFNEKLINYFFEQSNGDVRKFLKVYVRMIEKLVSGELSQ
jgi:hypothetical protein